MDENNPAYVRYENNIKKRGEFLCKIDLWTRIFHDRCFAFCWMATDGNVGPWAEGNGDVLEGLTDGQQILRDGLGGRRQGGGNAFALQGGKH